MKDERILQELQTLESAYRQSFPDAQELERFSFGPENLIKILREANGREIVFKYPLQDQGVLDGCEYSFKEVALSQPVNPITLQELLYSRGLSRDKHRVKIVRHRDTSGKLDLHAMYREHRSEFLDYQRQQGNPVFRDCDYVVSFLGEEGSRARFVGVYRVLGVERETEEHFYYNMTEESGFEALKERVIIDWGSAAINWHQWLDEHSSKTVLEIQTKPFRRPFTDYLDFTLTFSELKELVKNQSPRDEWRRMLSGVSGVYLILDTSTGNQYIGSAYGKQGGIWGRWKAYVEAGGHGSNKKLLTLLEINAQQYQYFQFTVLITLPKTMPPDEVIKREHRFMEKFGSRAHGLNS